MVRGRSSKNAGSSACTFSRPRRERVFKVQLALNVAASEGSGRSDRRYSVPGFACAQHNRRGQGGKRNVRDSEATGAHDRENGRNLRQESNPRDVIDKLEAAVVRAKVLARPIFCVHGA